MTEPTLIFDRELIRRYDRQGPRYTSYPTAVQFTETFGNAQYLQHAGQSNQGANPSPLSLYFHIPFCATICFYCACNKIVTKNPAHTVKYLASLFREIETQGRLFDRSRPVEQLHWGGGSPTFLSPEQMQQLMDKTRQHFSLHEDDEGEYSIEIDPRTIDAAGIGFLRRLGFNRISLGVQDFDAAVQRAVNRLQSEQETLEIIAAARQSAFKSVSVDLIYGLPLQSVAGFERTLDKVIAASPDRISLFNYAHLPQLFKTQRQIDETTLPSAEEKLRILQHAIEQLSRAGYVYIGMDHFAKPEDELAIAQREGTLSRNFQGYATRGHCDIVGMGVSSIGRVGNSYSQNEREIDDYQRRVDSEGLAVFRGITLTPDDELRRAVINQLICHFELNPADFEARYRIDFAVYFALELRELAVMQADGLLAVDANGIRVLPPGRLLIRNICMVFDSYLRVGSNEKARFSKVI
ncbi:MAG TPA: oxygen-independent coproporphyrinogen III oxidase [Methylococcaceae bacterium]|nr:oxygen-independent coproporphyrinogen III oxidase [Methylococcaceae bacterium]